MTDFALLLDNPAPAIRKLAAEAGLHDPEHRGELAQLFDGGGRTRRYLRRSGVSLDGFGELLWDRGITGRRLTPDEVFRLLSLSFDCRGAKLPNNPAGRRRRATRDVMPEIDKAAARAKRNRLRKSICSECGAIGYASAIVNLEHCAVRMLRVDPTFNEVMTQVAGASPAPF